MLEWSEILYDIMSCYYAVSYPNLVETDKNGRKISVTDLTKRSKKVYEYFVDEYNKKYAEHFARLKYIADKREREELVLAQERAKKEAAQAESKARYDAMPKFLEIRSEAKSRSDRSWI